MTALLEVLISFVGAILLLALVSQSLIEVVKATFPIEGFTRIGSARQLLEESARAAGLAPADGRAIYAAVAERLRQLGQPGWFGVRLDSLSAAQLKELVDSLDFEKIDGLEGCDRKVVMTKVAERVEKWFDLAMTPVSARYRRRMRVTNLVVAVIVVLALNVDAFTLMERARSDPEFRASVLATVGTLDTLLNRADSLEQVLRGRASIDADSTAEAIGSSIDEELLAQLDSAVTAAQTFASEQAGLFDVDAPRDWGSARWWLGILLSALLISLGAPFWHDLLGTVFGLRRMTDTKATALREGSKDTNQVTPLTSAD